MLQWGVPCMRSLPCAAALRAVHAARSAFDRHARHALLFHALPLAASPPGVLLQGALHALPTGQLSAAADAARQFAEDCVAISLESKALMCTPKRGLFQLAIRPNAVILAAVQRV